MSGAAFAPLPRPGAEAVRLALDGGTTVVQLREKKCDGGYFTQQVGCATFDLQLYNGGAPGEEV